jgi:hypothetical protein
MGSVAETGRVGKPERLSLNRAALPTIVASCEPGAGGRASLPGQVADALTRHAQMVIT